jgi:uncharacterized phage-associated protein
VRLSNDLELLPIKETAKTGANMAEITADQAAGFLIALSQDAGDPVTNLKLQKLLYYAQGWYLALYNDKLFEDRIEAWPHGPVVPRVYGRYKAFRWEPITAEVDAPKLSEQVTSHLNELMEVHGAYSAYQLERSTHRERPWLVTRGNLPPDEPSNAVIDPELMREYFSELNAEAQ